ncbi:hypothetical protein [Sphingobacterium haloxyli]|uniref:Uncharacterized protein n=1 Tax=Sphingobacterium haloxyli TaxID=2100533 RepID=A0A2S9J4U2_9SPHI|nr:hypothetical protein [Sphingobacterium haloxyli]PRD47801.1 hypothetical protein C5745_07755 [Sphingobacterium haloxyli]
MQKQRLQVIVLFAEGISFPAIKEDAMKDPDKNAPGRDEDQNQEDNERREQEEKIDEQLEQTFPASDPPSYSQPQNDTENDD